MSPSRKESRINAIKKMLSTRSVNLDAGLLLLRIGAGVTMALFHGWGKISGGPDTWARVGGAMENLGLGFAPAMWGFFAAFAEFFGALFVVLGVAFRPAAALVAFTMLVAALRHLNLPDDNPNAGWRGASHAIELLSVFLALFLAGAGRYTITQLFAKGTTAPNHD